MLKLVADPINFLLVVWHIHVLHETFFKT
jgi:hypothetical protein